VTLPRNLNDIAYGREIRGCSIQPREALANLIRVPHFTLPKKLLANARVKAVRGRFGILAHDRPRKRPVGCVFDAGDSEVMQGRDQVWFG
jgi:hypothetical protein